MAEMAWMTNDPDTLPFLTLHSASWPDKGGFNSGYYSNKQLDRLLDKARVTNNLEERAQLYRQVQKLFIKMPLGYLWRIGSKMRSLMSMLNISNCSLTLTYYLKTFVKID